VRAYVTVAAKWAVLLVALLMVLLSLDAFDVEVGLWAQMLAFLTHSAPGLLVGGIALWLWKKPLWFGLAAGLIAVILTIVFGRSGGQFNFGLLTIVGPLLCSGAWLTHVGLSQRTK
jgi:hypothetical protein